MAKQQIDRHVEQHQVSFTLLVDETDMKMIDALAKEKARTKGFIVREAIKQYFVRKVK